MFLYKFFKSGLIILLLPVIQVVAQTSFVRQAEKKMTQGNWQGAHQALIKALKKDTLNVQAEFSIIHWFLNGNNPARQIDSAYGHSLRALRAFRKATVKQKEKLKRDHTDSASIVALRVKIDSAAFEEAKQINTEKSYQSFLQKFPYAKEQYAAIELRDEIAFLNALRQNSYVAYENYLRQYPNSLRAKEVKERYEKLLFEAKTKDKKLKSYFAFANEFPNSPYKLISDKNIFELTTCGGTFEEFSRFISEHPKNLYYNLARDILFHISREVDEKLAPELMTDSLKNIVAINKFNWVLIYKN